MTRIPEPMDGSHDEKPQPPPGGEGTEETGGRRGDAAGVRRVDGKEGVGRREFLRRSGLGAGVLAAGGGSGLAGILASCAPARVGLGAPSPEVVVVGAGAFGGWTAYHLRRMGARVTLVDMYGPGNVRSTSGDYTRGIRTSYGARKLWVDWANRAVGRWREFDEEWGRPLGVQLFHSAGDLILRDEMDGRMEASVQTWDELGIPYEILTPDEVRYRWPQFDTSGFGVGLFEVNAGVAKARRACETVAEAFRREGGELVIARATMGTGAGGRLHEVVLNGDAGTLGADLFVFALGPWFPKEMPDLMGDKIRIPMGNVFYFGTPPGDDRFLHPNMPSFGFQGGTGWPSLPPDHGGLRFRTGGQAQDDPDTSKRWIPPEAFERPRELLAAHLPDLAHQPVVKTHVCHYESSPDREWIIDRHPEWENVWIAGAGNAEGFKFGPKIGEYIAERVLDRDKFPELAETFSLSEERFAEPAD